MSNYLSYPLNRIQNYVNWLSYNPFGNSLLQEANNRGVRISYAQTEDGVLGYYSPNSNTIFMGPKTINDPRLGLSILAHELVHANTREDGNSRHEEGMAFVVGEYIAAQLYGQQLDGDQINQLYYQNAALYPELPAYNTGFNENLNRVLYAYY